MLPNGQMGNRPGRSTETAIRLVTDAVETAWSHGAVASLLQLDIKGAFDTVLYARLTHTLLKKGIPKTVVRWVRSWLEGRGARLSFEGRVTKPIPLETGVP